MEQFDVMADAPNGIQKLRQLILQLAVRGKLVPQDSSDEPASELLRRIEMEKERLFNEGSSGNSLILSHNLTDVPFEIPEGWSWAQLGKYTTIIMGQSPPSASYNEEGEGIPFFQGKADFGPFHPIPVKWCTQPSKTAESKDILISVRAPVGPTNMLMMKACIGRGLAAIRTLCEASPWYLLYLLRAFQEEIAAKGVGSTFVAISRKDLDQFFIPIPPVEEQHRIVVKVDQLMKLCDELEERQRRRMEARVRVNRSALHHLVTSTDDAELAENWSRVQDNFHLLYDVPETVTELRQAIVQLAVRGKLVPQDPNDEPASVLLERIEQEKQLRTTRRDILSTPDEVPFAVPEGWEWTCIAHAGAVKLGRQRSPKDHHGPYMRPYLRVANVQDGWIDFSDVLEMNFSPEEFEIFQLQPGDILLNEGQSYELVGRPAVYHGEMPGVCFQNTLIRFRPYSGVDSEYACMVFRSYMQNGRFRANAQQTTNVAHLSAGRLSKIEFPLPPYPEQLRIVERMRQLMAFCDALEAKLALVRTKAESLASAVVHHFAAA